MSADRKLPTNEGKTFRRSCWLRVGTLTKYVVVRSRVGWFLGHWIAGGRRSARCPGAECLICAGGKEPEVFWYLFVQQENGEVVVWNVPRRFEDLITMLEESPGHGIGCVLSLVREGVRQNSPISVGIQGEEAAEELDIEPFVKTLGNGFDLTDSQSVPRSTASKSMPSFT